jgi:ectoine hydroxylase-related dioxygenase (phytanoyl-CoA dioxygenase family)
MSLGELEEMKLSNEQVEQYRRDGYLVVEDVLSDDDLAPVIGAIERHLDARARELYNKGLISNLCEDEPFERRYAGLYRQSKEIGSGLDIMYARQREMFEFLFHPKILDVAASLLGNELTCSPIQHLRAKVPSPLNSGPDYFQNVPWHQDAAVTLPEADPSEIITFWIPLVDATQETGCMEVMPGVTEIGLLQHQAEGGTQIVPDLLPDVEGRAAECRKGGIVIMNKYTPHRGLPNRSDKVRWSIDLRYQRTGEPTGRPFHPAIVVRSEQNPESVMRDYDRWCELWIDALENSKGRAIHRV